MKILKKIWKIKNNFVYLHRKCFKYSVFTKKPPRRDGAEAFNFYSYLKRFNLNDFHKDDVLYQMRYKSGLKLVICIITDII